MPDKKLNEKDLAKVNGGTEVTELTNQPTLTKLFAKVGTDLSPSPDDSEKAYRHCPL